MINGFWKLSWVETKVFMREPMGVIATLGMPVLIFVILGESFGNDSMQQMSEPGALFNLPIFATLLIAVSTVISLVAVVSIYREGGILKRLRATPLSPITILAAHVFVKTVFSLLGLGLLVMVGRRLLPGGMRVDLVPFAAALVLGTMSILALGFVIASVVPTARFAQPLTAALFYPMIGISGLFFPLERLGRPLHLLALALPTTHTVSLLRGVWDGNGWLWSNAIALIVILLVCTAVSARVFRWE